MTLAVGLTLLMMAGVTWAEPDRVWNGAISDDWFVADNWTPDDSYPLAGETVAVTNGAVLLTNVTAELAAFSLSDATLTFTNWSTALRAEDVVIGSNGWVTVPPAFTDLQMSNRVVFVCSNFHQASGGVIDVAGRGYDRKHRAAGYGPGGGNVGGSTHGSGAGHGGQGGTSGSTLGGGIYGLDDYPTNPGSGGGEGSSASGDNMAGAGGGAVLIDAPLGHVTIDGLINADGVSTAGRGGGGSGGSILIICNALSSGPASHLTARGGDINDTQWGAPGGGGRVTVLMGIPETDRDDLALDNPVTGLRVHTNISRPSASVAHGVDLHGAAKSAASGTWRILTKPQAGFHELLIDGQPLPAGQSSPQSYGVNTGFSQGATVTNTVASPVADQVDGQRWVCLGWELFDSDDNLLLSGSSTQAVFSVNTDLRLVWIWTNEYRLVVTSGPNGAATGTGWYTNGTVAVIQPEADSGYLFSLWNGDLELDDRYEAEVDLVMDRPRTVQAAFALQGGQSKTWSGVTGSWLDHDQWTPPGIPGAADTVVIPSGSVVLSVPQRMASLLVESAATLVFTNWTTHLTATEVVIAGVVTLPPAFVDIPPLFTETQMSNRVHVICHNFTLLEDGVIDVAGRGFGRKTGTGKGLGGGNTTGGGGGYGGRGGDSGAGGGLGGLPYGCEFFPVDPGSGGGEGANISGNAGKGGGAVWIDAKDAVVVNGVIDARGTDTPDRSGGGSGGSILITCRTFGGGATGGLLAQGGDCGATDYGGAGGGGRIAIWMVPSEAARQQFKQQGGGAGIIMNPGVPTTFSGAFSVNPGDGGVYGADPHPQGAWPGTCLFFLQRGTMFLFR